MDYEVDISDLIAFISVGEQVPGRIQREMGVAGRSSGLAIQRLAQSKIRVKTGTAKALTQLKSVTVTPSSTTIVVASTAQSATGFPYPIVIEEGRGEVVPTRRKYLRFEAGGKVVFTKHARAVPPHPFMQPALDESIPFVLQEFRAAYERAVSAWMGR
jgi:hypothetical protein